MKTVAVSLHFTASLVPHETRVFSCFITYLEAKKKCHPGILWQRPHLAYHYFPLWKPPGHCWLGFSCHTLPFFFFTNPCFEIISLLFNYLPRRVRGGCAGRPTSLRELCTFRQGRWQENNVYFFFFLFFFSARLLQKPRLDCAVKNGPRSAPRSVFFFHHGTIFSQ